MDAHQLAHARQELASRVPFIGAWQARRAAGALAQDASPEAVAVLVQALAGGGEPGAQQHVLAALGQVAQQGSVEAQEGLCRLVIERGHELAGNLAIAAHYAPGDENQRALFYFLTEQWDQYESLDFDHNLLRVVYRVADAELRQRLAAVARRAGRSDWVTLAAGGPGGPRLGQMTDQEWGAALAILEARQRWDELWHLAQEAPIVWGVRLLRPLRAAGWAPLDEHEQEFLMTLIGLAEQCTGEAPEPGGLMGCHAVLPHGQPWDQFRATIQAVAVSPDGRLLATGGSDHRVHLWSLPNGAYRKSLDGHESWIHLLAMSPDGRLLASGSTDKTVRLWQLPSGKPLATLAGHRGGYLDAGGVRSMAISPDGSLLASGDDEGVVRLWSLPDGASRGTLSDYGGHGDIAFTPDGQRLACSGSLIDGEHPVQVWELPVRKAGQLLRGHAQTIRCLAISSDGAVLAAGGHDGTVRLWRLPNGAPMAELRLGSSVSSLAISPRGTLLAAAGAEGFIQVWRLPAGERLVTLYAPRSLTSLVISPDGQLLISGPPDHAVRVWRLPDGAPLATLEGHAGPIKSLAISPDGRVVISGSTDGTVRLWTSELVRLSHVPLPMTTHDDLDWVETALREGVPSKAERSWLELLFGLMRWRRRFDIIVEESASEPVRPGPFDILIED